MTHYCTYFDRNYLIRGLALYYSMQRHCQPFVLHVLCLDDATYDYFASNSLTGITPIRLADLENADPELLAAKRNRSRVEYYFTLTPALVRRLLDGLPENDSLVYIDSDFYFFDRPEPFTRLLADHSVAIVEHRFPLALKRLEVHGRYNVGILGFRNDAAGRTCVDWWRERCLEWCYDRLEGDKFADQKYLDEWPSRFPGIAVCHHSGVNVAPWNVARHRLSRERDRTLVDGDPLICFHFHKLRMRARFCFQLSLTSYGARISPLLANRVYRPYIQELVSLLREIPSAKLGTLRGGGRFADTLRDLWTNGPLALAIGRGFWIL